MSHVVIYNKEVSSAWQKLKITSPILLIFIGLISAYNFIFPLVKDTNYISEENYKLLGLHKRSMKKDKSAWTADMNKNSVRSEIVNKLRVMFNHQRMKKLS